MKNPAWILYWLFGWEAAKLESSRPAGVDSNPCKADASRMSTGLQSTIVFLVFALIYLGQALFARFGVPHTWGGKALIFLNQWFGVLCFSLLCGAVAAFLKMNFFSEGHFGTSISGLAWSGPPSRAGIPFAIVFVIALVTAGAFLYRSPKPSVFSDIALFLVPGACMIGGIYFFVVFVTKG